MTMKKIVEQSEELKLQVASLMKDPNQKEAFSEMIVEYAQPQHIMTDFIGMLLNTRALKIGDSLVKKVRKGIKVHTFTPGAIPLSSQITVEDRINYMLDGAVVDVNVSEWDLESGELGTADSIVTEMQGKFRDYILNKVFSALATAWSEANTADNFTDVGGDVTKTALDAMIKYINRTTPGAKAIVGTRTALYPIMDFAGFDTQSTTYFPVASVREEIARTGWLGSYKGVPIVVISQEYNNLAEFQALVPEDKILVMGENVGEFITYGPPRRQDYTDNQPIPPRRFFRQYQQFGMLLTNLDGIGILKVA
jgi:hypothetical protein